MITTGTVNETSFAVATFDGVALILDALAAGGADRRSLLTRAQDRLDAALRNSAGPTNGAEFTLVRQLQEVIKLWERNGEAWA